MRQHLFGFIRNAVFSIAISIVLLSNVSAEIEYPTGAYTETHEDLKVKVLGGFAVAQRTWYRGKWEFVRATGRLYFEYDQVDGSLKVISRNGDPYDRKGNGDVYEFGNRRFITVRDEDGDGVVDGYRWHDRRGNTIDYNADGYVVKYADRNNVSQSLIYDDQGRKTGVLDHFGEQVLWYEYNDGKISAVRDSENRIVRYTYTGDQLTTVTDVLGNDWKYEYDGAGRIARRIDPEERVTTLNYTASGRVFTKTLSSLKTDEEYTWTYYISYDRGTREFYVEEVKPGGRLTVRSWYDDEREMIRREHNDIKVVEIIKDRHSRILIDRNGNRSRYDLDGYGNIVKIIYPDSSIQKYTYDAASSFVKSKVNEKGVITEYEYDLAYNVVRLIEAKGLSEERITLFEYNEYGLVDRILLVGDSNTETAETNLIYDSYGNLQEVQDAENNVTRYIHNLHGKIISMTDAASKVWRATYYKNSQLRQTVSPLGVQKSYVYNGVGNKVVFTDEGGNIYKYKYNVLNRLTEVTGPDTLSEKWTYDSAGNLSARIDEVGVAVEYEYDDFNRIVKALNGQDYSVKYSYSDNGVVGSGDINQAIRVDYPTYFVEHQYDTRNRRVSTNVNVGASDVQRYRYSYTVNGMLKTTRLPDGNEQSLAFDALNRVVGITNTEGNIVEVFYDDRDNRIFVKDSNQGVHEYDYDRIGRLLAYTKPLGQQTEYSYDSTHNLKRKEVPSVGYAEYEYDDDRYLVQEKTYKLIAGEIYTEPQAYEYSYDDRGLLTRWFDGVNEEIYTYDSRSRLESSTVNYNNISDKLRYTYSNNGHLESIESDEGIQKIALDHRNRLEKIELPMGMEINYSEYHWDVPTLQASSAGIEKRIQFDGLHRVKSSETYFNENVIASRENEYDVVGNLTRRVVDGIETQYEYDSENRLLSESSSLINNANYSYDAVNNRISSSNIGSDWKYNQNNELISFDDTFLDYDNSGNIISAFDAISGNRWKYSYDFKNQLVSASRYGENDQVLFYESYQYDPLGRRISKYNSSGKTIYTYSVNGLSGEYSNDGELDVRYFYGVNSEFSSDPVAKLDQGVMYLFEKNQLGVPDRVINMEGEVVWSADFDAFGNLVNESGEMRSNIRLPGQIHDRETGLHYNLNRYYNPKLGRYMSVDPLGLADGINYYSYARANPVTNYDPDGLEVRFMCRFVDFSIGYLRFFRTSNPNRYAKHCFVYVTCPPEGWQAVYSLFSDQDEFGPFGFKHTYDPKNRSGGSDPGNNGRDDPFPPWYLPRNPWNEKVDCKNEYQCQCEKEIRNSFNKFPSGKTKYKAVSLGARKGYGNSNGFARDLIINSPSCVGRPFPGDHIFGAPGIGTPNEGQYRDFSSGSGF